ncbi:MAG: molybdopterin-dependent oxidoreductase [Actinomycetota bacterium]|nr:molybdopterin-dependent oxidoreductase [Actinomycetota bacterium]
MIFLIRSGMEIIATHPYFYWNDHSKPGTEFARFTKKVMPKDRLYDTLDEEESYSSIISMPGKSMLGMGRHWHFFSVIGWVLTGLTYVVLLFATGQYERYLPNTWEVFPEALRNIITYLSFELPPIMPGEQFDAVQLLSYAGVVFILAPFQILTGAAQSPAIEARFPWFVRMWGGRQWARNLHLFGHVAFIAFILVHVLMVVVHGFGQEMAKIIFGSEVNPGLAIWITAGTTVVLIAVNWAATKYSLRYPRSVQKRLGAVVEGTRKLFLHPLTSRQDYSKHDLSPEHRVNGKPPTSDEYKVMAAHNFADYKLEIGGLVERPMVFTLEDLRVFPTKQTQRVLHNCVQGWSSIGEWTGVPLRQIVELVRPLPEAKHICFLSMQDAGTDEPSAEGQGQFYETVDLDYAYHPQCILAYEMNGGPLPIQHGAPLRLRLETQVGFKMAKWIERIDFVSDYGMIGEGTGGWREDNVFYDRDVGI